MSNLDIAFALADNQDFIVDLVVLLLEAIDPCDEFLNWLGGSFIKV
jgi:hypothetical protein